MSNASFFLFRGWLVNAVVVFCVGAVSVSASAQLRGNGNDLGAVIDVVQQNPLAALVTITPAVTMNSVLVEVPNDVSGNKTICTISNAVAGQKYSCTVSGSAGPLNSGLVVVVTGVIRDSANPPLVTQKRFTVPNPLYDRDRARQIQDSAQKAPNRLQSTKPNSKY